MWKKLVARTGKSLTITVAIAVIAGIVWVLIEFYKVLFVYPK